MRSIILFFILVLSFNIPKTEAQVFGPDMEWIYCSIYFPPNPESCFIDQLQDVILEGDTMKAKYYGIDVLQFGKEVWVDSEKRYDFALKPDDSLTWQDFTVKIDSVQTRLLFDKNRVVQYCHSDELPFPIVLVEGLGALEYYIDETSLSTKSYFFDPNLAYTYVVDPKPVMKCIRIQQKLFGPFEDLDCHSCEQLVSTVEKPSLSNHYKLEVTGDRIEISGFEQAALIQFFTTSGQLVKSMEIFDYSVEIDASSFPVGLYMIRICNKSNGKTAILKFVKRE